MRSHAKRLPSRPVILLLQLAVLIAFFLVWHVLTDTKILSPFFFGTPGAVLARTWADFASGVIWYHLGITLLETALAFIIGTVAGIAFGFWFARAPLVSVVFDPYIKAVTRCPAWCWRPSSRCGSGSASGRRWRWG
ncbi:ABC transporter permease [Azospirillum sp. B506]|uniref:ABC transporter permease n=1 Tax=Azospirillum sp. B506 TaxID=137721 RepID=UPI000348456E|nr:hypothetical protein [Azospirillum sp. B506]